MNYTEDGISRRSFFRSSALALGGLAAMTGPFEALMAAPKNGGRKPPNGSGSGYGPLVPAIDSNTGLPLLLLPEGFTYESYGWAGDPMSDGSLTPPAHDGMGVTRTQGGTIWLTRNHEIRGMLPVYNGGAISYDPFSWGGTTNLVFNSSTGLWEQAWLSLTGTSTNCAGGVTPWGSWLTCEETLDMYNGVTHGWVFEVPADQAAVPMPLRSMGRFVHEAVTIDPATGYVYETEDRGTAGFYRFRPNIPGQLEMGGTLEMLKVKRSWQKDLRSNVAVGESFPVEWLEISDPERAHSPGTTDSLGVYTQGFANGGATFKRLEGAWYGNGNIYFNSTTGGSAGAGQVWEYNIRRERIRLIFESANAQMLDNPDNITVSPRGGILLCEDGDGAGSPKRLMELTADGKLFPFAQNNVVLIGEKNNIAGDFTRYEWAGATFSPDGTWLFVNIQAPGITFAITGDWNRGSL